MKITKICAALLLLGFSSIRTFAAEIQLSYELSKGRGIRIRATIKNDSPHPLEVPMSFKNDAPFFVVSYHIAGLNPRWNAGASEAKYILGSETSEVRSLSEIPYFIMPARSSLTFPVDLPTLDYIVRGNVRRISAHAKISLTIGAGVGKDGRILIEKSTPFLPIWSVLRRSPG